MHGVHNTIAPRVRGFDRIVTGPVESLDVPDWMNIVVGGELWVPDFSNVKDYQAHFSTWSLQQLGYQIIVPAEMFKHAEYRPYLEQKIRYSLVDELLSSVPINMQYRGTV